jgi:epoxide hydrolase A/B
MAYPIDGATQRSVAVNGVELSVYEAGTGMPVVFSHGFPELAFSWRHQIRAVAEAGFRAVAPDQRGYGGSSRPGAVRDYDIFHLTGDLVALLDELGEEKAVFVGHDWGGFVVWQMPLLHPERVAGVVGVNTPYFPRLPMLPTEVFKMVGGENHYIVWFQTPEVPDRALAENTAVVFEHMLRRGVDPARLRGLGEQASDFVAAVVNAPVLGEPLLTSEELEVFVSEFERTGFTGGINWYRNFDHNWEQTPEQDGATIDVPAMMVTAEWDPVLTPAMAQLMPSYVADLETHMIHRCGHWTQQEHPDELNRLLVDWLRRRFSSG